MVEEFASFPAGTYPLWYDPVHWNQHVRVKFDRWRQWTVLLRSMGIYYDLVLVRQSGVLVTVLALLMMAVNRGRCVRDIASSYSLLLPSLTAVGLYALVWVEPRYLCGPMIQIWAALLIAVRLPGDHAYQRVLRCCSVVLMLAMVVPLINAGVPPVERLLKDLRLRKDTAPHVHWAIAQGLKDLGIKPGDHVAILGTIAPYWARLAGVRVVARVPEPDAQLVWAANDKTKGKVLTALARSDIRALVARAATIGQNTPEMTLWRQLGHTDHYVCLIPP